MYRWFNRADGVSTAETETKIVLEKDETLQCTPRGQVVELKSRPIYSFTRETSRKMAKARPKLAGVPLQHAVRDALRMPSVLFARAIREAQKKAGKSTLVVGVDADGTIHIGEKRLTEASSIKKELRRLKSKRENSPVKTVKGMT